MRALLALPLALVLGGCARFPDGSGVPRYTQLTFRFSMRGPVDPNYVYAVAIRPFFAGETDGQGNPLVNKDGTPVNDSFGPVPVLSDNNGSRNPNGIVAGRPTRLIVYNRKDSANGYLIYRFAFTGDPDNPVDLGAYDLSGEILGNSGLDPGSETSSDTSTLGFTIDTTNLVDDPLRAQQVAGIQFNILVANKPLRFAGDENGRGADAIGNQKNLSENSLNAYLPASLLSSKTFRDEASSVPEALFDVYGVDQPSIDIKSWSLDVRLP